MIRGFWKAAQEQPARVAVIDTDGTAITAGDLLASANRLVHGLRSRGLSEGDCIAMMLPNSAAVLELLVANMQVGWHIVPLNYHLAPDEIAHILADSGARAFISHARFAEASLAALEKIPAGRELVCLSVGNIAGFTGYEAFKSVFPASMPENRVAGHFMQYTSGTTGRPKGVQRQIYKLEPEVMADIMCSNLTRFHIKPGEGNVFLCPSPMYHTAPLGYNYFALHLEHTVVLLDKWDEEKFLSLVQKYRVTTSFMVPIHFHRLLQLPEATRRKYDVSSLKTVLHAAAPCPVETKRKMLGWWGNIIYEFYGGTEGGGTIASPEDWLRYPGTVGKAWEGAEIRIYRDASLDPASGKTPELCATGEVGVIYMKLSQEFVYRGDEKKTTENRIDNFFTVGDMGYLNEEGFLFLCDRKIDMIISGGVNIYPAEIETVLQQHPMVADVAVFGIPNADWGEEVKAVVEPRTWTGIENGALATELSHFCREKLAGFKCPRSIDFTRTLPRDPNGKLYKRKLRDPYWKKEASHGKQS